MYYQGWTCKHFSNLLSIFCLSVIFGCQISFSCYWTFWVFLSLKYSLSFVATTLFIHHVIWRKLDFGILLEACLTIWFLSKTIHTSNSFVNFILEYNLITYKKLDHSWYYSYDLLWEYNSVHLWTNFNCWGKKVFLSHTTVKYE
jgi:hypothetical protein